MNKSKISQIFSKDFHGVTAPLMKQKEFSREEMEEQTKRNSLSSVEENLHIHKDRLSLHPRKK